MKASPIGLGKIVEKPSVGVDGFEQFRGCPHLFDRGAGFRPAMRKPGPKS
jgi:hypothetical protein